MFNIDLMKNALEIDWSKYPNIFFLTIIFFISRVPFLNSGFGVDPDAWRIANSALDLNQLHIYHTSRFPGYPVPEFFNSVVINYGWLATNSLTMILTFISVIAFALILKELNIKNKGLLVITYAFLPIIWINSINTMDYMWALTFIMLVWLFIIKKHYYFAGLMMGLAVGSRITSIIVIFPFIYLILRDNQKITKEIFYFIVITTFTVLILFLPLLFQYNLSFLSFYPTVINSFQILTFLNQVGILALAFGSLIFLVSAPKLINNIRNNDKLTLFLLFESLIVFFMYLGAPYEVGYIIPAIPFMLLLLNNLTKRKLFVIFCAFLLLNSFVSFGISINNGNVIKKGALLDDAEIKDKMVSKIETITDNLKNSIVISAEYLPILYYLNAKELKNQSIIEDKDSKVYWNYEKNVGYVYTAPKEKIESWQNQGYKIYYMGSSAIEITKLNYHFNLQDNNTNAFNVG